MLIHITKLFNERLLWGVNTCCNQIFLSFCLAAGLRWPSAGWRLLGVEFYRR